MPLTPADVHNVSFRKPPIGKRGYDEDEVNAFLDELEGELSRLIEENVLLRTQVGLSGGGGGGDDYEADRRMHAEVANLSAQVERARRDKQAVEHAIADLRAELEQARSSAGGDSDDEDHSTRVLMMAQRTADDHMNDARREADQVLTSARSRAEEVVREALAKAGSMEREAHQRHQDAISSLTQKRSDLLQHLDGLAMFVQDYRERLMEALTRQLQEVGDVPGGAHAGAQIERPPLSGVTR